MSGRSLPEFVTAGDLLTVGRWNRLAEAVYARQGPQRRPRRRTIVGDNGTGSSFPAMGVATLGTANTSSTRPDVDLEQAGSGLIVTGPTIIPDGAKGHVHLIDAWAPSKVLCSDATVVAGDTVGPVSSSFQVGKSGNGLIAVTDYDSGSVWVTSAGGGGRCTVAKTTTQIPARSGDTPGGPTTVTKQIIDPVSGDFIDSDTVDIYSWVNSVSKDPADMTDPAGELYIFIAEGEDGNWYWTGEDCSPPEDPFIEEGDGYTIQPEDNLVIIS